LRGPLVSEILAGFVHVLPQFVPLGNCGLFEVYWKVQSPNRIAPAGAVRRDQD